MQLIQDLLSSNNSDVNLEEVKLVMTLKWQRNQSCRYNDFSDLIADAKWYEYKNGNLLLLRDMKEQFEY